jgi:hypothetical protein
MIPEVTEKQVALMQTVCYDPNMSVFSQCNTKPEDDLQVAVNATQARRDAEYLCTLGFLKNITADHREQVDKMNENTGREWQVYEIKAMGRAMFQASTSSTVN